MVKYGHRIIYDTKTGFVLNGTLNKMCGDLPTNYRPKEIEFIDLDYDNEILENALEYHVDIATKQIIIDRYIDKEETEEEKLRREKEELENQLLIEKDKQLGGIL